MQCDSRSPSRVRLSSRPAWACRPAAADSASSPAGLPHVRNVRLTASSADVMTYFMTHFNTDASHISSLLSQHCRAALALLSQHPHHGLFCDKAVSMLASSLFASSRSLYAAQNVRMHVCGLCFTCGRRFHYKMQSLQEGGFNSAPQQPHSGASRGSRATAQGSTLRPSTRGRNPPSSNTCFAAAAAAPAAGGGQQSLHRDVAGALCKAARKTPPWLATNYGHAVQARCSIIVM